MYIGVWILRIPRLGRVLDGGERRKRARIAHERHHDEHATLKEFARGPQVQVRTSVRGSGPVHSALSDEEEEGGELTGGIGKPSACNNRQRNWQQANN
ncbi:hypothetical protein FRC0552_02074 [Corynebacterium diphtheriae]|nr:hypothetical protein FRC0552_02074 [Corynebacterium diphtheriae]CAB1047282.1 hypothetical protein FRC0551_02074 [Corynebacterium diphtheriae]